MNVRFAVNFMCRILLSFTFIASAVAETVPIFKPNLYIPISSFLLKTDLMEVSVDIRPDLLQYLETSGAQIYFARESNGYNEYMAPTSLDSTTGLVSLSTEKTGKFVLVTDAWNNQFPISTHWDQTLNSGKGGVSFGATDAINDWDIDVETGLLIKPQKLYDTNPNSDFYYNTEEYALFANDTISPESKTPFYERYVGENYNITGVSDLLAIHHANRILEKTGYPIIFKNFTNLSENIPAFQLINSIEIKDQTGKESLTTVLLPPYWNTSVEKKYPIIFDSYYDINETVYNGSTLPQLAEVVINAMDSGKGSAIGLFWNGGGAYGSFSAQRSVYDNAAVLFNKAEQYLKADPHAIIAFGFSRSSYTPLLLAGNPYHSTFTFHTVIADSSPLKFGDQAYAMDVLTYPNMAHILSYSTGYKYAWMEGWKDPIYFASGSDLLSYNAVGASGIENLHNKSAFSDLWMSNIKSKGTNILFRSGTHDSFKGFYADIEFVDKAKAFGIPIAHDIIYRTGHNMVLNWAGEVQIALFSLLDGTILDLEGTRYFRRKDSNNPEGSYERFYPSYQPFLMESPRLSIVGRNSNIGLVGEPNAKYKVDIYYAEKKQTSNSFYINEIELKLSQEGTLSSAGIDNITFSIPQEWAVTDPLTDVGSKCYLYKYYFRESDLDEWNEVDNSNTTLTSSNSIHKYGAAVFDILSSEPIISGVDLADFAAPNRIAYGISEY